MSEKLLPCPFCGSEAVILQADQYNVFPDSYYVSCTKCTAGIGQYDTETEAIEAWNRRAERTVKVEKVTRVSSVIRTGRCGNCGYDVIDSYKHCPNCGVKLDWSE